MKKKRLLLSFLLGCMGSLILNAQWTLEWSEEFDYVGSPDPVNWNMENWTPGWVNEEDQAYTDRIENAYVANGTLTIEALKDYYNGWEWTSARLNSSHKHDALYGRIEVRAMLPKGTGTWPAIWMLPSDWVYGGWPRCGEIDIMEHVGKDPGVVHASVHTESYNHSIGTQVTSQITVSDYNTAFHIYAIEWTPNEIKMFVDDNQYFIFNNEGTGVAAWPFDKPFHVILNLAMGGAWGGRIDRKLTSAKMVVDYVRMYSYDAPADNQAPTAPINLTGSTSSTAITLNWQPASDNYSIKEYVVYQSNSIIGTTIWHDFSVNGLNPLTSYSFKVLARDYSGNESGFVTISLATTDVAVQNIPGIIEAENYDAQFGVQIEATSDVGGGENVGWIDNGDWMDYYLNVLVNANFVVDLRIASLNGGGEIQFQDALGATLTQASVPQTGDWQVWTTISTGSFALNSGTNKIRVYAGIGGFNLNWLEFREVGDPANDNQAPTIPSNLSAIITTTTANFSWSGSTDNIAVEGYNVFLDGQYVASTAGTSYQFTGLSPRTGYILGVSAFDAAGNESGMASISKRTSAKSGTVSISSIEASLKLYPNPAKNQLMLTSAMDLSGSIISIYDIRGKQIQNLHYINNTPINITDYKCGIYYLNITNDNENITIKFVKQ